MNKATISLVAGPLFAFFSFLCGVGMIVGKRSVRKEQKGETATFREVSLSGDEEAVRPIHKIFGCFFILLALSAAALCFFPASRKAVLPVLCGGYAFVMLSLAIYYGVITPLRCTQRVSAKYIYFHTDFADYRRIFSPRFVYPVFYFEVDGRCYPATAYANIHFRKEFLLADCPERIYYIFINPRNPYEVCTGPFGGTALRCLFRFLLLSGLSIGLLYYPLL